MKRRYYFLLTADEFELPVYIETSWNKLAKVSHISRSTLVNAWLRGSVIRGRYKIEVINY